MSSIKNFIKEHYIECIVFYIYIILYFVVCVCHEPMYDEAQSFLIARDATFLEILTKIPHYEGHPPLWHLIIAIFAKSGLGFEASLRIPGAVLNIIMAYMIIFKAPFNKYVRCILPFTYYLFFRYGVIVRPYVLTCLVLILLAHFYDTKREKPFRYMIFIMLLCLSTAYGMCIACGLCLLWAYEIIKDIQNDGRVKGNVNLQTIQTINWERTEGPVSTGDGDLSSDSDSVLNQGDINSSLGSHDQELKEEYQQEDKKNSTGQEEQIYAGQESTKGQKSGLIKEIIALSIILLSNIGLAYLMMPNVDTNAVESPSAGTFIKGLIYMLFIAPADSMFLDAGLDARLQNYADKLVSLSLTSIINLIIGAAFVALLIYIAKKANKLYLLIVPYVLFAIFSAYVYFWYHHIGLVFGYILFVMWVIFKEYSLMPGKGKKTILNEDQKSFKNITYAAVVLCLGMSLAWSVFCSYTDITKITWHTKELAKAVEELGLDQDNTFLRWDMIYVGPEGDMEAYKDPDNYLHVFSITQFFDCLAYLDENVFLNHNIYNHDVSYNMQSINNEDDGDIYEELCAMGYPEFFVGEYLGLGFLDIDEEMPNYVPVYRIEVYKPDKFIVDYNDIFIYAREDIYQSREEWPIKTQLGGVR